MEDYDDDEDDYFWLLAEPVAEADDLAENTMPSPVWLDYDSDKEVGETFTDLEYYSDDYYDHPPEATSRERVDEEKAVLNPGKKRKGSSQPHEKAKRRCVGHTGAIPELSLGEPLNSSLTGTSSSSNVVRWLTNSTFAAHPLPLLADDEGEKVALLKDWRDRFKIRQRDDIKVLEPKSGDYEVPVMKGGLSIIERGNQADGSKAAQDSATEVEVEQNHADCKSHMSPKSTSKGAPTTSNGVVFSDRGFHPTGPRKARTTVNGTKSRKRPPDIDEESETRQMKRKTIATADTQPGARPNSLPSKPVPHKRRGDDPPESLQRTEIALRSQEAKQHNLQHDAQVKVSVPAEKSEKLSEAGKVHGGMSQTPAARRSKRAKRGL
ncbi:hypothetical protein MMC17_006718 [Xylographa soralifera]|nr:hypothetical protein [Xylographa soralifera]